MIQQHTRNPSTHDSVFVPVRPDGDAVFVVVVVVVYARDFFFHEKIKNCAQVKENEWEISSYKLPHLESGWVKEEDEKKKHFQYQRSHL